MISTMRSLFLVVTRRVLVSPSAPVLWAAPPTAGGGAEKSLAPPVSSAEEKATSAGPDPEDLRQLMVDHSEPVFRLALSVVRDRALAEDVTQETMLKAWVALPTFRGDSSLRGWVMRIAHNTAISTLRSRRAIVSDPDDLPEGPVVFERSIERRVEGALAVDHFVEALDLLDELSRSIVVLRELEGMSYDEISRILGVPLPTVKTRLLRSRRLLGNALREWR